ncbi:hypothetical protein D9611_006121 [Ephemerocybe angulata]|uniref:Uncharacterized protein n=1 Tax=Ephemerocybe angulata TaxID=980116 RepID=A0A8H5CG99_9AGAR|nr:hypothetical protein D9611_006121 [Tulosesus angulatus]
MFAQCWKLELVTGADSRRYWRAVTAPVFEVNTHDFVMLFPELVEDMTHRPDNYHGYPPVSMIQEVLIPKPASYPNGRTRQNPETRGVYGLVRGLLCPMVHHEGNRCLKEDHESLQCRFGSTATIHPGICPKTAKEYNVHFLCTSNLAPPLEMLEGIVEQIDKAQKEGIWAWDCTLQEPVLIFPVVLALLGDNPMQSEMAAHIGLRGRKFCRACHVERGKHHRVPGEDEDSDDFDDDDDDDDTDADTDTEPRPPTPASPGPPPAGPSATATAHPESRPATPQRVQTPQRSLSRAATRGRRVVLESLEHLRQRIDTFMKPSVPRDPGETKSHLKSFFRDALTVGKQSAIKKVKTRTGVKDTFQNHFLEKIFESYKKKRTANTKQAALDTFLATLPMKDGLNEGDTPIAARLHVEGMMNPVWRIKGINAHSDTPVEVLHVVLLGFVKYFWRDVVRNQLKGKDDKKRLLETRLSCLDVAGLGLSPLPGPTLVRYAGSLVGRDFRAIAQVAPFVLHDLVTKECYEAWKALSRIVPLIWQPEIANIEQYKVRLQRELEQFLLRTAKFGPAILFATEAFESFNAIIRAKSVHSNRQAPSRDIAAAFAQGGRIRHFLSGGYFLKLTASCVNESGKTQVLTSPPFSSLRSDWATASPKALQLVEPPSVAALYLGLRRTAKKRFCHREGAGKAKVRLYSALQAGAILPEAVAPNTKFYLCSDFQLQGGDKCSPGHFVIASQAEGGKYIGRVKEILQLINSTSTKPDAILLERFTLRTIPHPLNRYGLPDLEREGSWALVRYEDLLCTVNAQHACAVLKCGATGTANVPQERAVSEQTRSTIVHVNPLDRLVLNTNQMRDAIHLQPFSLAAPLLPREETITQSAEAAYALRVQRSRMASAATAAANIATAAQQRAPATPGPAPPLQTPVLPSTVALPPAPDRVQNLRYGSSSAGAGPSNPYAHFINIRPPHQPRPLHPLHAHPPVLGAPPHSAPYPLPLPTAHPPTAPYQAPPPIPSPYHSPYGAQLLPPSPHPSFQTTVRVQPHPPPQSPAPR